jgi:tetratricopeptide (TPR) repeat protein
VQRLSSEGEHFRALTLYDVLPDRRLDDDTHVAAAKSAWALGLVKQAADLFDAVLRGSSLSQEDRARLTLSRGAIEYQEGRYQEAALFAEKAASLIPEGAPLRGRALLLWGQSLVREKSYATAEDTLTKAMNEALPSDRPEIALTLGAAQLKIGKLAEAERSLKAIPTEHPAAPEAIRMLSVIALRNKDHDRARFWIERGQSDYSADFLDSWADFGLVKAAIEANDLPRAQAIAEQANKRYPPSDTWLILAQAALEQAQWNKKIEEPK